MYIYIITKTIWVFGCWGFLFLFAWVCREPGLSFWHSTISGVSWNGDAIQMDVFFSFFLMENHTQIWMNRGTNLHFSISCQKLDSIHSDVCTFWYTNCDMAWVSSILRQTHVSMLVDVGCISHCPMISNSNSTRNPNYTPWNLYKIWI